MLLHLTKKLEIRKAKESDFDSLKERCLEVHSIHLKERPDEFRELSDEDIRLYFFKAIADENQDFLVCCDQRKIVGYILTRIEDRQENPVQKARKYLYIDQIDVKHEYRRSGVGKLLIKSVKDIAKKRGLDLIILDVWNFNEDAVSFFGSQGFLPWIQRMGMSVD